MRQMNHSFRYARVLTIAGSDSGGGAGIQADLKTFMALGCYGTSAVTALTAQNTIGVQGIHTVPPEFLKEQIQSVLEDIGVDAVKIGMLPTPSSVECLLTRACLGDIEQVGKPCRESSRLEAPQVQPFLMCKVVACPSSSQGGFPSNVQLRNF